MRLRENATRKCHADIVDNIETECHSGNQKVVFLEHMHVMPAVSAGGCIFPLLNMMYVLSLSGWTHSEAIVPNSKRNEMGRREGGVPSGFNKWPGIYRGTVGLTKGG